MHHPTHYLQEEIAMRITLSITRGKKPTTPTGLVDLQQYRAVVDDCFGTPAGWLVVMAPDRDTARRGVSHQAASLRDRLHLSGPIQVSLLTGPFDEAEWSKKYRLGEMGRIVVTLGKPGKLSRKARKSAEATPVAKVKVAA